MGMAQTNESPLNSGNEVGYKKPPKDKQFGQPNGNPTSGGHWKKEDTARFKLEKMLGLSEKQLQAVIDDVEAPFFERKLATCIQGGNWKEVEGMMNQVYGQPKATTDITSGGKPLEPLALRFLDGKRLPDTK